MLPATIGIIRSEQLFVNMISISPTEQQYNQATKGVTTYKQVKYDYSALEHWNILANLT